MLMECQQDDNEEAYELVASTPRKKSSDSSTLSPSQSPRLSHSPRLLLKHKNISLSSFSQSLDTRSFVKSLKEMKEVFLIYLLFYFYFYFYFYLFFNLFFILFFNLF